MTERSAAPETPPGAWSAPDLWRFGGVDAGSGVGAASSGCVRGKSGRRLPQSKPLARDGLCRGSIVSWRIVGSTTFATKFPKKVTREPFRVFAFFGRQVTYQNP